MTVTHVPRHHRDIEPPKHAGPYSPAVDLVRATLDGSRVEGKRRREQVAA